MDVLRIGQAARTGERLVSEELERLAPTYGAKVLDNLLLHVEPGITARLGHVIVDRFGALIIDARMAGGAAVIGSEAERRWKARLPDGQTHEFTNPLVRSREHETVVRQALRETGNWFGPDYVRSAVVFSDADLSGLTLDSRARAHVFDVSEVETLLRERPHTAPSAGALLDAQVAGLAGLFRGLDHTGDPWALQAHAESLLEELMPDRHALLMHREKPKVEHADHGTTYHWEYLGGDALVSKVSITVDRTGQLLGLQEA